MVFFMKSARCRLNESFQLTSEQGDYPVKTGQESDYADGINQGIPPGQSPTLTISDDFIDDVGGDYAGLVAIAGDQCVVAKNVDRAWYALCPLDDKTQGLIGKQPVVLYQGYLVHPALNIVDAFLLAQWMDFREEGNAITQLP